jgi:hypothetical protein
MLSRRLSHCFACRKWYAPHRMGLGAPASLIEGITMRLPFTAAAIAACLLASAQAQADEGHPFALPMSGGRFLSLCENPPSDTGPQVVAMCQMYVAGIADGLKADNQICFGAWLSQRDLFRASAWWIGTRAYETRPAAVMIKTGLLNTFPCARRPNVAYGPPTDYHLQQAERFVRAMAVVKEWLLLFGIK